MRDLDQHAAAIDRAHLKTRDLAHAQASAIGRSQRRPVAQARNRFEKPHDLLGAEHHRQFLRLATADNALKGFALAERDAVEEPQRAGRLVDVRPVCGKPRGQPPGPPGPRQVRPLSSTSGPACIYSEGGWIASAMTASARSDEAGR